MTVFTVHRAGECTTERCRCGFEITYRIEGPSVRNARRSHQCRDAKGGSDARQS